MLGHQAASKKYAERYYTTLVFLTTCILTTFVRGRSTFFMNAEYLKFELNNVDMKIMAN